MRMSPRLNRPPCLILFAALASAGVACTGTIGNPGQSNGGPSTGGPTGFAGATGGQDPAALACAQSGRVLNAGVTPLRRLTRDQ